MVDADTSDPRCGEMGLLESSLPHDSPSVVSRLDPHHARHFPGIFDLLQLQDLTLRVPHLPNQVPPRVLPRFVSEQPNSVATMVLYNT